MVEAAGQAAERPETQNKKRRNRNACDSALMPGNRCSECVSFNCECVHPVKKFVPHRIPNILPKGASPPARSTSSASSRSQASSSGGSQLHPLVTALTALLPSGLGASATLALAHISTHIINLEHQVAELRATCLTKAAAASMHEDGSIFIEPSVMNKSVFDPSTLPTIPAAEDDDEDAEPSGSSLQLVEKLSELSIQPGQAGKHFGPSSTIALVGMALKILLESNTDPEIISDFRGIRRPSFWALLPWETELEEELALHDFPAPDLMADLIEIYFVEVNIMLPLLHKPTFLRNIRENKHILNPHFGETVLVVCALGSRWSSDPRVLLEGDDVGHSSGWRWFRQVRLFRRELCSRIPSVYELQTNILSALYLAGSSQPELAWVLLGLGIRYAVEVGAHRKRALPSAEGELWKRAFWIIWCYDGLVSSFMGRPRATLSNDFDVDLPIDCDDEYWEAEEPFKQPPNKLSKLTAFISFIKLVKISEYAQANLFSIKAAKEIASGRNNAQDIVAYLDSELNRWLDSVPAHLRWENFQHLEQGDIASLDPDTTLVFRQAALLQGTYHHIHILAHRPFIFSGKPDSPMFSTSWAICTNAARACIRIMKVWQPFITVHFTIMAAAIITLLEKWKVGKQSSYARESVVDCLDILTRYERTWIGAGKLGDVIRELLYLDDLMSRSAASPGGTSPRGQSQIPTLKPEDIFSMATDSFPTIDLNFLGRGFIESDEGSTFAMLF